jgi:hypothetical protein
MGTRFAFTLALVSLIAFPAFAQRPSEGRPNEGRPGEGQHEPMQQMTSSSPGLVPAL